MENEVTINIESSLAAMAYVLADQQKEIQTLREASQKVHADIEQANKAIDEYNRMAEKQNKEYLSIKDERDELKEKNVKQSARFAEVTKQCEEMSAKVLKWVPFPEEGVEFRVEEGCNPPVVLVKTEQVDENYGFQGGGIIPVGHIETEYAIWNWPGNMNVKIAEYNGKKILAYCVVTEDNFSVNKEASC